MATTYCTVEDVGDYLRIPITATTVPNKVQVEKIKAFTGSGNGNILAEVPNASALVNSKVFEFLVIGY